MKNAVVKGASVIKIQITRRHLREGEHKVQQPAGEDKPGSELRGKSRASMSVGM
jgi:hypothetical protein